MPRTFGSASVNGAKRHRRRRVRRDVTRLRLDVAGRRSRASPATLSIGVGAVVRRRPAVTVTRSCPENVDRAKRDRRHRHVATSRRRRPTPASASCLRGNATSSAPLQPVFWKSLISTASRRVQRRRAEDALGQLERGAVARRAGRRPWPRRSPPRGGRDRTWRACSLRRCGRRARASPRSSPPERADDACARRPARAASDRRSPCSPIDRAARRSRARRRAAAAASALCGRNGRANAATMQRDRRRAHQQQQPVADPPPPHRLIRDPLHEHQRRELRRRRFRSR